MKCSGVGAAEIFSAQLEFAKSAGVRSDDVLLHYWRLEKKKRKTNHLQTEKNGEGAKCLRGT